jgi:hypothetical protein
MESSSARSPTIPARLAGEGSYFCAGGRAFGGKPALVSRSTYGTATRRFASFADNEGDGRLSPQSKGNHP